MGETVSLHRELDMSGQRPLTGKRYLVPKIGSAPTRLKELLQKQGASVDEIQAGEIAYLDRNWDAETFREVDWLIFGSKHGVEAFFSGIQKSGVDIRSLFACKIAAVGAKTAGALRAHGIFADLVPKEFHSDALAEEFDVIETRRGAGLMQGLVCKEPVAGIIAKAMEKGLILINAGSNIIRFVPALIISKEHIDEMTGILRECLSER